MELNGEEKRADEVLKEQESKPRGKSCAAVAVLCSIISACAAVLLTLLFIDLSGYNGLGLSKEGWEKLKWGFESVNSIYYEDVSEEKLVDGALLGLSSALDDYSLYMSKDDAESFMQSVDADSYSGVGLYIYDNTEDNTITVITPLANSPAEKAGIKTNDKIVAVNQKPVTGEDLTEASDMMMGEEGSRVSITVLKADTGKTVELELTREKIKLETVGEEMLDDEIGYIEITQFGVNTYQEFVEHYNSLCDKGMKKLIIDLRNNPGGYFDQAINIADIFIDKGDLIVYTMDKNGKRDDYKAQTAAVEVSLVLLANEGTASASEVLIGALCDSNKAILVGEQTFGKGVTQALRTYDDGSAFKITDTKYYTPSGKCIDEKGIKPDIKVKEGDSEDLILEAGIKAFK